ncbi:hypothetical protein DFJ58DRAFT_839714 [Suillus subalutaceus]|uniref:uncharacterized protein n=1 Tax=Suillus subalutaceus TaxID=48586 RepID=UPI001B85D84B|nr:uncharacterized protein DFJ58DRAFT_839714 [Suillus subalutaceus]KAG1861585.1 hypothetical protein DFJ58DRAFT_839714 [Suillus subalutaceus]
MGDYVDLVGHWQTVAVRTLLHQSAFNCSLEFTACTAALLFDFCITFDSEVRWIWGRKWGITRIAFVISRYLPVGTVAMYLYLIIPLDRRRRVNPRGNSMNTLGAAAADGHDCSYNNNSNLRVTHENTPLVSTVYWDGMIYMLCIALTSMVNCVGIIKLPVNPVTVDLIFNSELDKPAGSRAQRFDFAHPVQSTSNKRIAGCLYSWASYLEGG